jgi:hypothetical protein
MSISEGFKSFNGALDPLNPQNYCNFFGDDPEILIFGHGKM